MKYKQFTLDKFQEDAIHSIEKHNSVVVSAATGTGKTLIADYIIDKFLKKGKRVIYTAPIKALSNQKYRDFIKEYGKDKLGILTGDIVINDRAQILIMTTEIYRNMLLSHTIVPDLSYVIFDEIHYMNDPERGTVWEESIIFSPNSVRFLCLSATIPNAEQFASWIREIKKHKVDVVKYMKRAVPLQHSLFDNELGVVNSNRAKKMIQMERAGDRFFRKRQKRGIGKKKRRELNPPNHLFLIEYLREKDMLPSIFFTFGRKMCRDHALESIKEFDFTTQKQKDEISRIYSEIMPAQLKQMRSIQELRKIIVKGIAIHHAGLLPKAKELVEVLFSKGLISVLYATETFAVGINMPARSVCFDSLRKFDGRNFRYLHSKEYYQIAGRAGRRGIDKQGYVFAMIDKTMCDISKVISITSSDSEPIISQFQLSVNMVLSLIDHYDEYQIETILKQNFGYFVKRQRSDKQIRIISSFKNMMRKLRRLGYITKNNILTARGRFASKIYADELLLTELLFSGAFSNLRETDINVLLGSIVYESRRQDRFDKNPKFRPLKLETKNRIIVKRIRPKIMEKLDGIIRSWSNGCEFPHLMKKCNLQEGDLIRLFRQIIDRLQQIKKAESQLTDKLTRCIKRIDRDVVKIEF